MTALQWIVARLVRARPHVPAHSRALARAVVRRRVARDSVVLLLAFLAGHAARDRTGYRAQPRGAARIRLIRGALWRHDLDGWLRRGLPGRSRRVHRAGIRY